MKQKSMILGSALKRNALKTVKGGSGLIVSCDYYDVNNKWLGCNYYSTNYTSCPYADVCVADEPSGTLGIKITCSSSGPTCSGPAF
ncbi:MAG: hypothetical protein QM528_06890 [Phycisphaerales bacterium]|nr:hypothetical protein [Phycisphaerales bacterium]